jgi:NodT family efflux transporter outer membrane factor (OMF) lipoprotein
MKRSVKLTSLASTTALAALLFFSACAVGPDFKKPAAPDVKGYVEEGTPGKTTSADTLVGAAQNFETDKDIPADWWKLYHSDALNQLMDAALKANPDLKAAQASLTQANELYYAQQGVFFPAIDATAGIEREKFSGAAFGEPALGTTIFNLYTGALNISYTLDIWGGNRRLVEEAHAQADYQHWQLEATYLTLTTNVVVAAVQEASLREQVKETQSIVDIETNELGILRKQLELGAIPKSNVLAQQTTVAQQEATLAPLEKQLAQKRHQLLILAGRFPSEKLDAIFELDSLQLPQSLPLTLPSKLVDQRPDIKAAEAQLHAASAQIGVATSNMLPQISISGQYAAESPTFSGLSSAGANVWNIGANLTQPIFQGGTLLHERRAAVAAYDKAAAQYKSTVLNAFGNVADTLRALQYDAESLKSQLDAANAAKSNLDLANLSYKAGSVSYPQLLDAQHAYATARIALVQAEASRLSDTAALFQSLGGGWWNQDKTPETGNPTLSQTEKK